MIIRALRADRKSFRTVRLKSGANIVLADRVPDSDKRITRNGSGKTAILEIVSFCLGGHMGETLRKKAVKDWSFTLDAEQGGRAFSITRKTGENVVEISGDTDAWPGHLAGDTVLARDGMRIGVDECRQKLGRMLYGLEPRHGLRYRPTFGSLVSYCVRRGGRHGGYGLPFQCARMQPAASVQVNNAYMLDLDWEIGARLRELADRKRQLRELEKNTSDGVLPDLVCGIGDLEAILIRLEDRERRERDAIDRFRVHDQYADLEREANALTESIHTLVNEKFSLGTTSEMCLRSIEEENDVKPEHLLDVYKDAGVLFPDLIKRELDAVRAFHTAIVRNRRDFLVSEIERLGAEAKKKGGEIDAMGARRASIMETLQTHGALEELAMMQARHNETLAEQADAANKLAQLRRIGDERADIDAKMSALRKDAEIDFDERRSARKRAILAFNDHSNRLYKAPGKLVIDIKNGLYRFDVEIERSNSSCIDRMKIFCYDMMLAGLWAGRPASPGFLVHDSDLFEGVDSRQTAKALQVAEAESREGQFQYICTMNTDDVPADYFDRGFGFDSLVAMTLTDKDADGGLLGIRF